MAVHAVSCNTSTEERYSQSPKATWLKKISFVSIRDPPQDKYKHTMIDYWACCAGIHMHVPNVHSQLPPAHAHVLIYIYAPHIYIYFIPHTHTPPSPPHMHREPPPPPRLSLWN